MSTKRRAITFYAEAAIADWLASIPTSKKSRIINDTLTSFIQSAASEETKLETEVKELRSRVEILEQRINCFKYN